MENETPITENNKSPKLFSETLGEFKEKVLKIEKSSIIPEKKQSIPQGIRTLVWNTYNGVDCGQSKCFCCRTCLISQLDFQCGHVISENKGGKIEVDNLRPICKTCNGSMGTRNMFNYINEFKLWGYSIEPISEEDVIKPVKKVDYKAMTINELKALAIKNKLNVLNKFMKDDYVNLMTYNDMLVADLKALCVKRYLPIKSNFIKNDYIDILMSNNINATDESPKIEDMDLDEVFNKMMYLHWKKSVKFNGLYLQYIYDQTEELCELAIKQNSLAINYVIKPTEYLVKLAMEQITNKNSSVKDSDSEKDD